ncbi:MAG TPA: permease [Bacillota bacterium]|nr:permease [Fastidiosipila sp.]HPX92677.1 permease [Bacillota bacterium]HQB81044.1 permease [Bacillota bacterium]
MRTRDLIRKNLFLLLVLLAYAVLFFVRRDLVNESVRNSTYYIREMVLVMPAVFVLTALLDLWIPKDRILQFLGKDAGVRGILLSFLIGSLSAGPIYAAFPLCVMLHKKGASIRNIVIILSSWAVIKLPMLLNEAKYLGFKFMGLRWLLTVLAILIFSSITSLVIRNHPLPENGDSNGADGLPD